MKQYSIHPDLKKYRYFKLPLSPKILPLLNRLNRLSLKHIKTPEECSERSYQIPGYKGDLIDVYVISPKGIETNAPCIIFLHGGAFVLGMSNYHKSLAYEYALKTPCKVIVVDYRLAPDYPFPYGLEDSYAALTWTYEHAGQLGIDVNKIALVGDSAGGCLAAGVTHLAAERGIPQVKYQMLIYPVTDARQQTESIKNYIDTPMWNSKLTEKMWVLYLHCVDPRLFIKASPMEADSFDGLPPAYVEVAEFDCLRDEGIAYAQKLRAFGIEVDLNETKGTIHGFEVAKKSELVKQCIAYRIQKLQKQFYE